MGLDMYAFITRMPVGDVNFKAPEDTLEIAYGRKHPNLHGCMEELYVHKGRTQPFNCATVRLDAVDLDALEVALNENTLPQTTGFFFGETRPEEIALDRAFIAEARASHAEAYFVFYDSWW